MDVFHEAKKIENDVIEIRRHLHVNPEPSMKEVLTMELVKNELDKIGINHETVVDGGIIGTIHGKQEGKTIILRADLDALAMKEAETNLSQRKKFVSNN